MAKVWGSFRKHWITAVFVSVAIAVCAIVAFLSGLAAIWTVMSRDTLPEFLLKKGWTVTGWLTGPPWMNLTVMVVALAVLIVQIALLRQAYTQRVYESGRVDRETLARYKAERDAAQAMVKATKVKFGREILMFLSGFTVNETRPSFIIRYVGHGPDHALVKQIKSILRECTGWSVDEEGKNDPILQPDERFKVVFEVNGSAMSQKIAQAFTDGELLDVPIGQVSTEPGDPAKFVIRVLPSTA